jgi:hypothetical protein
MPKIGDEEIRDSSNFLTWPSQNQKIFNAKGARGANVFNISPLASLAPFAFKFLAQKTKTW